MNLNLRQTIVGLLNLALGISLLTSCSQDTTTASTDWSVIEEGFQSPPNEARPRVWWHWMNGNISKDGIKKDLEWMSRIGLGGFQNFDASSNTPQVVENRLIYMTDEWKDAFNYAINMGDSLGFEMSIAASAGWSETGGPWVKPEEAMKKYVWSEIDVEGGKPFTGTIPHPPTVSGSFQKSEIRHSSMAGELDVETPEYYGEIAVVAFPIPENDVPVTELNPKITSSGGNFDLETLTDGDYTNSQSMPAASVGEKSWLQYEFDEPVTIQSFALVGSAASSSGPGKTAPDNRAFEVSDDGVNFRKITTIPSSGSTWMTVSIEPVTAKYFRVTWETLEGQSSGMGGGMPGMGGPGGGVTCAEFVLYTGARISHFVEKAGFDVVHNTYSLATPEQEGVIAKSDIIDLTSQMNEDGTINWTPPTDGKWKIIRFGYSLTGHTNSPASAEATGLEVDKMNADHVRSYINQYLDMFSDATDGMIGEKGIKYIITDSWEAGTQNWTESMMENFSEMRGYDMSEWLPTLAGYVVEGSEESDAFLWDFRKTIGELIATNHYDVLTEELNKRGMGRYSEAHEAQRAFVGDGMEMKRNADVTMSAMWVPVPGSPFVAEDGGIVSSLKADLRESASTAHIYGKKYVAAESLSAEGKNHAYSFAPGNLKYTADMALACGLTRFVIHCSVHQPVDDLVPGLSLGQFGQWFTRNETWAEMATPWVTYLSRSAYMLQQGTFTADIAYYYGEDTNCSELFKNESPEVPEGYNYDFVNADVVTNVFSVEDGNLVTPSGMKYKVLYIDPNAQHMTLNVLKRIQEMVNEGAIVIGNKPTDTPSLTDDKAEFEDLVNELWANENGINSVGKGKIYAGESLTDAMKTVGITPDFEYTKEQGDSEYLFVHRTLGDSEIYWINNRNDRYEDIEATFRVDGYNVEIWDPVSGEIKDATYKIEDGRTTVSLNIEPQDALFIVFRGEAETDSRVIPDPVETEMATIDGSWNVAFQEDRGAPESITLDKLMSWTDYPDDGVKFFSGVGTYTKTIQVPASWLEGESTYIDLGEVDNIAEVIVNGQSLGIVWKVPFRIDATGVLVEGENTIEIKVANVWANRLIGDKQPGMKEQISWTVQDFYQADDLDQLLPSGLIGPVKIVDISN